MNRIYNCLVLAIVMFVFLGCNKDQVQIDTDKITEYLTKNDLIADVTEDGLYYIVTKEGAGASPTINNSVTVHYKGYKLNGDIFDSSYDRGQKSTFPLSGVIQGWQLGIPLFKEGGSGTLIIPSRLAYGKNPPGGSGIKKNEVLIFDIELFEVK